MRHIISILMENEPGALSRVVGLFSQRGYNIENLNVAPTHEPTLSRLTVTTFGSDRVVEQITKHLNRLVEVVRVVDLTESVHMEREMLLVKVRASGSAQRAEIIRTVSIFRAQIVDTNPSIYTIQVTGPADKINSFLEALGDTPILEFARTGVIGMARGERTLNS